MIGYAKINKEKLKAWAKNETKRIEVSEDIPNSCWYNSLWAGYFYKKQDIYKDALPLVSHSRYSGIYDSVNNNVPKFISLMESLEDESQRLHVFYADDTAAIVGYQGHRFIIPAELAEIELLKDYTTMTTGDLTLLGNSQISEAMLPADMNGCSIRSVESELDEQKKQIAEAEEKCKQAIEEIRQEALRKEQELRALLEKETEKLKVVKEELENKLYVLDTQIYGIRCYLGEVVDFKQIRSGKAAASDVPVVIFQKIRFLDEEMGKYLSLYDFGAYSEDTETLIGALKARDDLRDIFCPSDRCVTVLRNSRTGKTVKMSDKVANMLEKYEYLHGSQIAILVRDGDNLYVGWTDENKVSIASEDVFLRPDTSVSEIEDEEYGFGHRYWSEKDRIEAEKKMAKSAMDERVSRFFLMSVLQGMIDRGGLLNIPSKTKITEESELVKFSFAEGWLTDNTYGDLVDILNRSKDIEVKKGEILLTGMHVTRDDIHDYGSRYNTQYQAYSNNRGIGERNRTHGAGIPALSLLPVNKVLKEMSVNVTFALVKGKAEVNPKYRCWDNSPAYSVVKDPSGEVLGTYTCKMYLDADDFNAAGTLVNLKKVVEAKYKNSSLWYVNEKNEIEAVSSRPVKFEYLPDLTKVGVPEIKDVEALDSECHTYISVPMQTYKSSNARVNFEIMSDEYIRTTYLCSTWLKYVITTKHIGDFRIGGTGMSYAEALKYLNKLIGYVKEREEEERKLLMEAGGEDYLEAHPEWDRELCEWRLENRIVSLTARSAKRFLAELRACSV